MKTAEMTKETAGYKPLDEDIGCIKIADDNAMKLYESTSIDALFRNEQNYKELFGHQSMSVTVAGEGECSTLSRPNLGRVVLARQKEAGEGTNKQEIVDRIKSRFLHRMSHELRTPLNAIIGFSELMLDGVNGDVNAEQRDCLQDIWASGQRLLKMADDILDMFDIVAVALMLEQENKN